MVTIGGDRRSCSPASTSPPTAWDFGYFFVAWGMVAILVLLGLMHGYFLPTRTARAREAAARDIEHLDRRGRLQRGRGPRHMTPAGGRVGSELAGP